MNILPWLAEPAIFFSILAFLFIVSIVIIILSSHKERTLVHDKEELVEKINKSFTEVVSKSDERERILRQKIGELEQIDKDGDSLLQTVGDLERKIVSLQGEKERLRDQLTAGQKDQGSGPQSVLSEQIREENVSLNSKITLLEKQLEEARQGIVPEGTVSISDAEVKALRDELGKTNQELYLKNEVYEGLKAQYSELEKSSEQLMHQLEEEKKSQRMISQKLWDITKPKEM